MVVLVLTLVPAGLRGFLTRWLMEISAGVFVGRVSARVREEIWLHVLEMCKDGRAIMVESAHNEQGLRFRAHRHEWEAMDFDGLQLMLRPASPVEETSPMRRGWSTASKRRYHR